MSRSFTARRTPSKSCSNENSGVCTPITTKPSARYACDHARTYGSWRSQLMHVHVQKFTSTMCPRSSAEPNGSELSHPVAPSREGMLMRAETFIYVGEELSQYPARQGAEQAADAAATATSSV